MNRPHAGRRPEVDSPVHTPAGRLRAYTVRSDPRVARKATKFRCRNCGQKVRVDAGLARTVITCPTCKQPVPAPQKGRLWLEVCGGVVLFLTGFAIGHGPLNDSFRRLGAPTSVLHENGKKGATTEEAAPKPHWFASQSDDD